ncbi:hypothetical protein DXG03_008144 [Asterophora parasitica]|uniref:AMP-activated protein kinase glycogen-binding domain-containing protein n=1 Tax=Asterophora parasitica TaxID=117018 RepID=A0A9P7G875_9AGAR|nr:hypothetical protein DXG03_008144 [Asterophora parasitica]
MAAKHGVVFEWPHTEPSEVIVTGTFNEWARTHRLTKGVSGFSGTAHVPWGSKTAYKFIVDGEWTLHDDQPTEADPQGNVNNVYFAPPEPRPEPVQAGASWTEETKEDPPTEKELDSVVGAEDHATGTEVGGLKADQIEVPKDLPLLETTAPASDSAEVPASSKAEDAPIPSWIVPVNAAENNTSAAEPSVPAESRVEESQEPRTIVSEPVEAGATVVDVAPIPVTKEGEGEQEANVEEKEAERKVEVEEELSYEVKEEQVENNEDVARKEEEEEAKTGPSVAEEAAEEEASKPTGEREGVAQEAEEVLAPVSTADEPASTDTALLMAAPGAPEPEPEPHHTIDTPQVNTPDSDLNPSSVTAPQETPVGAAAAPAAQEHTASKEGPEHKAIDTPQVQTPDSDLNPSSVTAQETPAAAPAHAEEQKQEHASELTPPAATAAVLVAQGTHAEVAATEESHAASEWEAHPVPQPEAPEVAEKFDEVLDKAAEVPAVESAKEEPGPEESHAASEPKAQPEPQPVPEVVEKLEETEVLDKAAVVPEVQLEPTKEEPRPEAAHASQSDSTPAVVEATTQANGTTIPATEETERPRTPQTNGNGHAQEPSSSTTASTSASAPASPIEEKKPEVLPPATPPKEAPSTPTKLKAHFPSQGSPSPSPSPSKTGTGATRKKRPSLFGKIKHLFEHDKEKDKAKGKK